MNVKDISKYSFKSTINSTMVKIEDTTRNINKNGKEKKTNYNKFIKHIQIKLGGTTSINKCILCIQTQTVQVLKLINGRSIISQLVYSFI